jgi:hypothetical protein
MTILVLDPDQLAVAGLASGFEGRRWKRVKPVSPD